MTTDQAIRWAKQKDAGTLSAEDEALLAAWIKTAAQEEYDHFYKACAVYLETQEVSDEAKQAPVIRMQPKYSGWWKVAAVLIVGAVGAYFWLGRGSGDKVPDVVKADTSARQYNIIRRSDLHQVENIDTIHPHSTEVYTRVIRYDSLTLQAVQRSSGGIKEKVVSLAGVVKVPAGMHYVVQMPDGSRVWMNALSSLTVAPGYGYQSRSMELTGEAYFEVYGDHRYPFEVKAGKALVQVLGTAFNINCYPNEIASKITLIEGAVRVSDDHNTVQLQPKEQALIAAEGAVVKTVNTSQVMAWKDGYIDFEDVNLLDILRTIERWYGLQIDYAGLRPEGSYTCRLSKNMKLTNLKIMLEQMNLQVDLRGRQMTIGP